jgi:hypothetical protein
MLKALLYRWFGIEPLPCATCEILREQLHKSEAERKDLLHRLLDKATPEPLVQPEEKELKPITPQFVPWRVRQQMLEAEDKRRAELLKQNEKLEKELGIHQTSEKTDGEGTTSEISENQG